MGQRYLKKPATPAKYAEVTFLMMLYATAQQLRTYDKVLLDNFVAAGGDMTLPFSAFDPSGDDRNDFALFLLRKAGFHGKEFGALACGETKPGHASGTGGYHNNVTAMISDYKVSGNCEYTLRKSCFLWWCWCFIDYDLTITALDRTDFNPGDVFDFTVAGIGYTVDDDLINDCHLGKEFNIKATSQVKGTWLENCNRNFR
jgi:hypothetical protein